MSLRRGASSEVSERTIRTPSLRARGGREATGEHEGHFWHAQRQADGPHCQELLRHRQTHGEEEGEEAHPAGGEDLVEMGRCKQTSSRSGTGARRTVVERCPGMALYRTTSAIQMPPVRMTWARQALGAGTRGEGQS